MKQYFKESFWPILIVLFVITSFIIALEIKVINESKREIVINLKRGLQFSDQEGEETEGEDSLSESQTLLSLTRTITNTDFLEGVQAYKDNNFRLAQGLFLKSLSQMTKKSAPQYYLGLCAYNMGHPADAIQYFTQVLRQEPGWAATWLNLGLIYSHQGDKKNALYHYKKALSINPGLGRAYFNMGLLFYHEKDYQATREAMDKALQTSSGKLKAQSLFMLGKLASLDSETARARKYYQDSINLAPSYLEPRINLALLEDDSSQGLKKTIEILNKVKSLQPNYPPVYYNLAITYEKMGKFREAEKHYRSALQFYPGYRSARYNLGLLYINIDSLDKAEKEFLKLSRLASPRPKDLFNLARVYYLQQDYEKAISFYNQALDSDGGKYKEALLNRGLAYKKAGENDLAIESYNKALRLDPQYIGALYNLGIIYKQNKDLNKAIEYFDKVINIKKDHAPSWFNKGQIYAQSGDVRQAKQAYQQAIQSRPDYFKALINLAVLYNKEDDYLQSVEIYKNILKQRPDYAIAWYNLGITYSKLKQTDNALEVFLKVEKLDPDNENIQKKIGTLYARKGNIPKAIIYYKDILVQNPEDTTVRYNLALQYYKSSKFSLAIEECSKIIRLDSEYWKAYRLSGKSYAQKKEHKNSIKSLLSAIEVKKDDTETLYLLAREYFLFKDYTNSKIYLAKCESIDPDYQLINELKQDLSNIIK